MDFTNEYKKYLTEFNGYLQEYLINFNSLSDTLTDAIRYALLGGGKRLRPVLFLAVYDHCSNFAADENIKKRLSLGIELIHNYTLIHDDLPCLDNDDYRRGRLSCHKKYGEAIALLAGDALLNEGYNLLLQSCVARPDLIHTVQKFCWLSGHDGLIGGQTKELEIFRLKEIKDNICEKDFFEIYLNKTAALFVGSTLLGAAAAGDYTHTQELANFSFNFGLAFQLKDDLNDNNKESFAYNFGVERTLELISKFSDSAQQSAKNIGSDFLFNLVDFEKYL